MAIDEVVEEGHNDSVRKLTEKVLCRLNYYFEIKTALEKSEEFVEVITSTASDIHRKLGGRYQVVQNNKLIRVRSYSQQI